MLLQKIEILCALGCILRHSGIPKQHSLVQKLVQIRNGLYKSGGGGGEAMPPFLRGDHPPAPSLLLSLWCTEILKVEMFESVGNKKCQI